MCEHAGPYDANNMMDMSATDQRYCLSKEAATSKMKQSI